MKSVILFGTMFLSLVFGIDLNDVDTGDPNMLSCASCVQVITTAGCRRCQRPSIVCPFLRFTKPVIVDTSSFVADLAFVLCVDKHCWTSSMPPLDYYEAPNLTHLCVVPTSAKDAFRSLFEFRPPITLDAFQDLAETAGPGMVSIWGVEVSAGPKETLCPSVLHQFQVLRSWRCEVIAKFDVNPEKILPKSLSALESLQLTCCTSSFLKLLSSLECALSTPLPYFFDANFIITALAPHGSSSSSIQKSPQKSTPSCRSMFRYQGVGQHFLPARRAHLSKIIVDRQDNKFSPPATESPEYISSLNSPGFPALREIQVPFIDWPATEFEISRSGWPQCSELLTLQNTRWEKEGVGSRD